jgi:Glycosyl transferase family 2
VDASAVFVGCAKDCAKQLRGVCENIDRLAGLFSRSAFVFVENDSTDGTKDVLQAWVRGHPTARLITRDGLAASCRVRTIRLAKLRNAYLRHVRYKARGFDYLIVLDCDEANEMPISCTSFTRAVEFLAQDSRRAAVFANQLGTYYDMWALRHSQLCPNDIWEEALDHIIRFGASDAAAHRETLGKRAFTLDPNEQPFQVESAFGGLGIYKVSSVLRNSARYWGYKRKVLASRKGPTEFGLQVCEHVSFNEGFRHNGEQLFILPFLINRECRELQFPPSGYRSIIFDTRQLPVLHRAGRQTAHMLGKIGKLVRGREGASSP